MDEFANRDKNSLNSVNFLFKIQIGGGGGFFKSLQVFTSSKKNPKTKTKHKKREKLLQNSISLTFY